MSAARRPGTPRLLRALNDRSALELLLEHGPLTRTRLGELTGLSKVTASQLVERLEERGLVIRVGEVAGARGPNASLYAVDPGCAYVIGVEVEADRAVAACADITGAVVGRVDQSTRDTDDPVGVVQQVVLKAASEAQAEPAAVRQVVLGTPGLVDPDSGDITFVHNLPRWHRGLRAALRESLDLPVRFENDVNLAAIAEAQLGAAAGARDFVLMWVGSGIGMAVVLDGNLHRGSSGAAGEIGYIPVPGAPVLREPSGRGDGGLQHLAGLAALRELAADHGFDGPEPAGTADPEGPAGTAGVVAAVAAAEAGDPAGEAVLEEIAQRLALGLASACLVLDPPLVVLAGEVGLAGGQTLAERVRQEVAALTLTDRRVVAAQVAQEPVLTGALHTALGTVRDEVFGSTVG